MMRRSTSTMLALLVGAGLMAQCPQLFDHEGVPSSTPTWYNCSGGPFTLVIASPTSFGPYSIDWGDGTTSSGAGLAPPATITHPYPAAVAEYTITLTLATGCTVTGTLVMEQSTSASIQIPVGGLTQACAPQDLAFINSSTNTSPNTTFIWDFGDRSNLLTFDHTNLGQTITHTYQKGTVDCETLVRLTAYNRCNMLQGGPSVATFNPIRIWDIDSAHITPSAVLLCWPDNEVTYTNTTDRNCVAQGNIYQRYEYWNFGDYWGLGRDSIIDWTPWPPTFPRTIAYPAVGEYSVMLLDSNYCGIDTAWMTIRIVPPPQVGLTVAPDTICAGQSAVFTPSMSGGANRYSWNFGQGGGWQGGGPGNQSRAYHTPGTYTVGHAVSIAGATPGCTDTAYVSVVVTPSPTAAFVLGDTIACSALTVTPVNASIGGNAWRWDLGDGTTHVGATPPAHTYSTVGEHVINLVVENGQGCSAHAWRRVHVLAVPEPQIGVAAVCLGEPSTFADLTIVPSLNPIVSRVWDLGDGTTSTAASPVHTYSTAGTYTVSLHVSTPYCSGDTTMEITVEALPVADFAIDSTAGCSPMQVHFTNTSQNATSYIWRFGDGGSSTIGSPTYTFVNTTNAPIDRVVELIAANAFGCTDTIRRTLTVWPGVVAAFVHDGIAGCAPMDVHFTNTSSGGGDAFWEFGDGNTSTEVDPSHRYVNTTLVLQTYAVRLTTTSPAGCSHTAQQTVTVYPTPVFALPTVIDSGCTPFTTAFPSIMGAVVYQWSFGDGSFGSGPAPRHTYMNSTDSTVVYPVDLTATNAFGCAAASSGNVVVHPSPTAHLTLGVTAGCQPLDVPIINGSRGGHTYHWDYGDGSTGSTADTVHTHRWTNNSATAVVHPVELTVTSRHGCVARANAQVEVYPAVEAAFSMDTVGCSPFAGNIINNSIGGHSYLWMFGDGGGSAAHSPTHAWRNNGLDDAFFNVALIVTSPYGCRDTATQVIRINPEPIAQFLTRPEVGCSPLALEIQDHTIGAVAMHWNMGDGTVLDTVPGDLEHVFRNTSAVLREVPITLVATTAFGCTDTLVRNVTVYPAISAHFDAPAEACSPVDLVLRDEGEGGVQWMWDMGNGVTLMGREIAHSYVNNGNADRSFNIRLVSTSAYGCTDTLLHTLVVRPSPTAAFTATPFSQQFPDATVDVINSTPVGPWNYAWDFGDGGTSSDQHPVSHTYATHGIYTISLVVSTGICADTISQQVTILPPLPVASFLGSGEGCMPVTVSFTNTSVFASHYMWHFGDGSTSTAEHPTHVYALPGTYSVSLTAYGIGGTTSTFIKTDSVVVRPKATAYFVVQPTQVIAPRQPIFTFNMSGNAETYHWNFGDGSISNEQTPIHYYQQAGTYTIWLAVNNRWNCPDTFTVVNAVTAIPSGEILFPNAFTPRNSGPTGGVYDPSSYDNDHFFPLFSGVESYQLQVFNRWGELLFETKDPKVGWDGYYRGQPAKQDVYVWKAYARFNTGEEKRLAGDVTLLR